MIERAERGSSREPRALIIDGHRVSISATRDSTAIPWAAAEVEYVAECTGAFVTKEMCEAHMRGGGVKKVIIAAPAKDATPTIVVGVNEGSYDPETMHVVCNVTDMPPGTWPLTVNLPDIGDAASNLTMTTAPAITAISPQSGSAGGGTLLTVYGVGFTHLGEAIQPTHTSAGGYLGDGGACLKTLGAYVGNLLDHPDEEKFRSINGANAAFLTKVGNLDGGVAVLAAVGFARGPETQLVMSADALAANHKLLVATRKRLAQALETFLVANA